jgi:hypothetical protein
LRNITLRNITGGDSQDGKAAVHGLAAFATSQ